MARLVLRNEIIDHTDFIAKNNANVDLFDTFVYNKC